MIQIIEDVFLDSKDTATFGLKFKASEITANAGQKL